MSAGSPNGILYLTSFGFHRLVCIAMQYISVLCSFRNGTKSHWLPGQFFNLITAILRKSENPIWFFLVPFSNNNEKNNKEKKPMGLFKFFHKNHKVFEFLKLDVL
jgi:hypothetical protein